MVGRCEPQLGAPLLGAARSRGWLSWQHIFYMNVFFACISFSIVMPSLWLYVHTLGGSKPFYAAVVAIYSVGEAMGSVGLGALSNVIGTRSTLMLCCLLALTGAAAYSLADLAFRIGSATSAPYVVLFSRLLQGIGSGGQQAVEQAYLSIAAPPEQRTELTGKLGTFACLGFILGPAVGACASQLPHAALGPLHFNEMTMQGWTVAALNCLMLLNVLNFVELPAASPHSSTAVGTPVSASTATLSPCSLLSPVESRPLEVPMSPLPLSLVEADGNAREPVDAQPSTPPAHPDAARRRSAASRRFRGIGACAGLFFVHFNGFAIQETITTPLVHAWYGWTAMSANLLFTAAGIANLICAIGLSVLSAPKIAGEPRSAPRVADRALLVGSLLCAALGWALMVPAAPPASHAPLPLPQFLIAFTLVTAAFPVGRGVCLAMAGKLLGDEPQGAWMGAMFALGAIARIAGPFWAVHGYEAYGAAGVFGASAALFALALCAVGLLGTDLVPDDARPSADKPPPLMHELSHRNLPSPLVTPVVRALSSPGALLSTRRRSRIGASEGSSLPPSLRSSPLQGPAAPPPGAAPAYREPTYGLDYTRRARGLQPADSPVSPWLRP